jgi:hypothetical protein
MINLKWKFLLKPTAEQNLEQADMADARVMNEIIWYSVRGSRSPMPAIDPLPAFDALREGIVQQLEEHEEMTRRARGTFGRR